MWIIIEGPTAAGKSTLYDEINKVLTLTGRGVSTVHMGRPDELTRRWALTQYVLGWETPETDDRHILADRWHWGEATYAPIYRPDTNTDGFGLLGVAGWRWVELFLMSRGAMTVYLQADDETLVRRLNERGDDHVQNDDELLQVARLYAKTVKHAPSVRRVVDTSSNPDSVDLAQAICAQAAILESAAEPLREYPQYIGSQRPNVLLVGDHRNVTRRWGEETQLPFMPVSSNSGDYLLTALDDVMWRTAGVINGSELAPPRLHSLWITLKRPPVIALGRRAKEAALRASLNTAATIPHPQYVRRFRHGEQAEYGRQIKNIALYGEVSDEWTL